MARKKQEEAPQGSPAWMATFSDLMNLLLCFFVLLFAMSTVDEDKFEELVASLSASFGIMEGGSTSIIEGTLISAGVADLQELSSFYNQQLTMNSSTNQDTENSKTEDILENEKDKIIEMLEKEKEEEKLEQSEEMAEYIEEKLQSAGIKEDVEISVDTQYVQLTLNGALLFDSGEAQVKSGARRFVSKVGDILKHYRSNIIEIEGHTDSVPLIGDAKYANNAELSSARALSVAMYLYEEKSIDIKKMKWTGRGEYEPIASNDTVEGRALNRRVEIKIYNEISSREQ